MLNPLLASWCPLLLLLLMASGVRVRAQDPLGSPCPEGYTWDSEIEQCRDIDECLTIADACKGGLRCVNNFGGYLCLPHSATLIFTVGTEEGGAAQDAHRGTQPPAAPPRTQGTSTGPPSVLRPPAALPALERLAFSAGELVEPPPGPPAPRAQGPYADPPVRAPHVVCSPGYEGDSAGRCVDVDECARGSHRCRPGQRCVNEAGSHSCRCPDGFTLLGAQCVDVDECRLGLCSHQCLNSPGSFRCACSIGFSLAADNRTCTDLDECEVERPCSQNCLNLYGSFLCRCDSGFELDGDQRSCRDVDECAFSQYLCQFRCENHAGSYACSCPHGYRLQSDTRSCRDVDECEEGSHGCPEGASCFNVQGSHRCLPRITCSAPYTLIGDNRCVCPGEIPACREEPYIVLHKAMQMQAGRTAPSDVFQMQATAQYPGAFYTFRIAAGDDAGHFLMRQIGSASAMLVLTRPVTGPRDLVLDLEMLTINPAAGTRGSSIIRLSIFVTEHPF
ncbi:fibulin-5-like [Lampetra planeri]